MTKYTLLRDLPGMKTGTIYRICDYAGNIVIRPEDILFESEYDIWYKLVENNPDWFAPVSEEWPKDGDKYFWVTDSGDIIQSKWSNLSNATRILGNHFRTREEAQHHKLRQESQAKRWKPEEGETYYYWSLGDNEVRDTIWTGKMDDLALYCMGGCQKDPFYATKWAKDYSKAFNVLFNS